MRGKTIEHNDKHEFALFVASLSSIAQGKDPGDNLIFSDEKLLHRVMNVLRLGVDDPCIFFDRQVQVSATIAGFIGKKQLSVNVRSIQKTTILHPHITFLLPVLKRDDFESALYALAELGVNTIQLIFTQKTVHKWAGVRDTERADKILIAAAEQSKNCAYPELKEPISLDVALKKYGATEVKIFFDPAGKQLFDVMNTLRTSMAQKIVLLIGPEGDLHREEKKMVQANDFIFCALTPTIVRAVQAAALGAGFVRSLL